MADENQLLSFFLLADYATVATMFRCGVTCRAFRDALVNSIRFRLPSRLAHVPSLQLSSTEASHELRHNLQRCRECGIDRAVPLARAIGTCRICWKPSRKTKCCDVYKPMADMRICFDCMDTRGGYCEMRPVVTFDHRRQHSYNRRGFMCVRVRGPFSRVAEDGCTS